MVEFTARDRLKLLAGAGTALLSACGGGGSTPPTPADMINSPPPPAPMPETPPPPPVTTSQAPTILSDTCLLYTSPSPRDATLSRMPSSA